MSLYGQTVAERHALSEEKLLYFTLFSLKAGLTYDLPGVVSGRDLSNAKRNQKLGLKVWQEALKTGGYAPQREFKSVQEFEFFSTQRSLNILSQLVAH